VKNQLSLLEQQYELVKGSREVVFQFCEKFSPEEYTKEINGIGRGSVRNLQVHIAYTYIYWLAEFAMKQSPSFPPYDTYKDFKSAIRVYENADKVVYQFIEKFKENLGLMFSGTSSSTKKNISVGALELFTHVITHEFHHKGQMMSMGRMLGYTPPDADIIRLF